MAPLIGTLKALGATFEFTGRGDHLPLTVRGKIARGGPCTLSGETSSQFLTALLFAAPLLADGLQITRLDGARSISYLEMTLSALRVAGITLSCSPDNASIEVQEQSYTPFRTTVGADYTSCSYFMAAAAMSGGSVTITGLRGPSEQGERAIIGWLRRMGACVTLDGEQCSVQGSDLTGDVSIDATDFPNIIPTLAVMAAVAHGTTELRGGEVTNFHKSPRLVAVVDGLRQCGVVADVLLEGDIPVGFRVVGRPSYPGGVTLDAREDHRLAKAFSLLSLRAERPITITGISTQTAMLEQFVRDASHIGLGLTMRSG